MASCRDCFHGSTCTKSPPRRLPVPAPLPPPTCQPSSSPSPPPGGAAGAPPLSPPVTPACVDPGDVRGLQRWGRATAGWRLSPVVSDLDSEQGVPTQHHHHCRGRHRPQREAHLLPLREGREFWGGGWVTWDGWGLGGGGHPFISSPQVLSLGPMDSRLLEPASSFPMIARCGVGMPGAPRVGWAPTSVGSHLPPPASSLCSEYVPCRAGPPPHPRGRVQAPPTSL